MRPKVRRLLEWLIGPFYSNITKPALLLRFATMKLYHQRVRSSQPPTSGRFGLERCEVFYINLASRGDRKTQIQAEFQRLGLAGVERFDAIRDSNGFIGCSLSHAAVLARASAGRELVMVCEDDAQFVLGKQEIDGLIESFYSKPWLDVLCLSSVIENKPIRVHSEFFISNNIQTTACYIIRREILPIVAKTFRRSTFVLNHGTPVWLGALDIVWKSAQRWKLVFSVPAKTAVIQRTSHSDIQNAQVDYAKLNRRWGE